MTDIISYSIHLHYTTEHDILYTTMTTIILGTTSERLQLEHDT
jgi:hypothetical protein